MKSRQFARFALPALAAALIGLGAQAARAQTSTAPSPMSQGSMTGMSMAAPATTTKKHHTTGHALPAGAKFSSLASAQAHCPGETVVWVASAHTHVFHTARSKYFGKSKHGAYVCETAALAAGLHASKR
jgi:hypothetical protein